VTGIPEEFEVGSSPFTPGRVDDFIVMVASHGKPMPFDFIKRWDLYDAEADIVRQYRYRLDDGSLPLLLQTKHHLAAIQNGLLPLAP
jgi:hypothetical protein